MLFQKYHPIIVTLKNVSTTDGRYYKQYYYVAQILKKANNLLISCSKHGSKGKKLVRNLTKNT